MVGLPGSGRSILFHALTNVPRILRFHLKKDAEKYRLIYLDLNFIPDKTTPAVLSFIGTRLDDQGLELNSLETLVDLVERKINRLKIGNTKLILILDSFDNLGGSQLTQLFKILKAIHDKNRFFLSYIFVVDREITGDKLSLFGNLGMLITENVFFLPPSEKDDVFWFIEESGKQYGVTVTGKQKEAIFKLSGGYLRTVKRQVQALAKGQTLEEIVSDPSVNIHLGYHFEQILEALGPEKETLRRLVFGGLGESDAENLRNFRNLYVIDSKNVFTNPLFLVFLQNKFKDGEAFTESLEEKISLRQRLTANEYKLLAFLVKYQGKICSREDLAVAVWGDKASLEVSNHAMDQLVHRLKEKLSSSKPAVCLETVRGRGHRLLL